MGKSKRHVYLDKPTVNKHNKSKKFKKMNCNPIVHGKTVADDSCFTIESLLQIKDSYNKHHPDNIITITEPAILWHELKNRINSCDKEDCWLKLITDESLRKKIDEMSFAPDHPPEWKKNPDEWLSNIDILEVLKQYEQKYKNFRFIGPTPIDFDVKLHEKDGTCVWEDLCKFSLAQMLKSGKTKLGVVFNLDKHNQGGSHWVALFVDTEHKFIYFLDSAGAKIPKEVRALVQRITKQGKQLRNPIHFTFYENSPFEHQKGNTECGMYCLFFIITMLTGKMKGKEFSDYKDIIKMFSSERIPDKNVFDYRKIYFNSD